ncbi:MAG: alpha/beta hydrolase [Anaerolineae bacterium]|nr:alpha/beta hydrolase [Anaerolineae bacterium]
MPSLITDPGIIHYETYGRGRPVLLLHGWLGSWELWRDTIEVLGREYRTYALDFFGFGDSGVPGTASSSAQRTRLDAFTVPTYVEMVYQFMERLGIQRAPLIGHSMGGTVALSMAIRHPQKTVKVCVIGSPINGGSLNLLLKLSGRRRVASLFWLFGGRGLRLFLRFYSHFMARDGRALGRMITKDVSKINVESFFPEHRHAAQDRPAPAATPGHRAGAGHVRAARHHRAAQRAPDAQGGRAPRADRVVPRRRALHHDGLAGTLHHHAAHLAGGRVRGRGGVRQGVGLRPDLPHPCSALARLAAPSP